MQRLWPASSEALARPALIDAASGTALTHAQLHARAGALADTLAERGVQRGDRVAVLCLNRFEVFEALYACARVGAALVPLNWRLSPAELSAIAADCAPAALLYEPTCQDAAARILADNAIRAVLVLPAIDETSAAVSGAGQGVTTSAAAENPASWPEQPPAGDVAMILYTSGTTGSPKGAMLTWRQIAFNAAATTSLCRLGPADRCLACLPLFHTGGLHCLATPLLAAGGSVVVMRKFEPREAVAVMERLGVTCMIAVPTMYQMLLDAGLGSRVLPALRWLLVGGAPCPDALFEAYESMGHPLNQGYGLTEVGPNCFTLSMGTPRGTVGVPMAGSEAKLVGEDGQALAGEAVGELCLRGPHVCAGYWNKPAETARARDGAGWFHTGDYARRHAGGYYSIAGRKKEMFISGGENVYPAEVENVLASHPAIAEIAVVGVPDERWGEVGLAVIVLARDRGAGQPGAGHGSADERIAELREWTRARLAAYKVPRHWRIVTELAKTPTGKIRKDALPALVAR